MTICFGENIKKLRIERGLTQEALAGFLGVSFQTISKCSCTVRKQATENKR